MTRHKHADVIHAWAEGKEIQIFHSNFGWINYAPFPYNQPEWDLNREYRIKPDKYQYLRDAIAEGKTIQYKGQGWIDIYPCRSPNYVFNDSIEYRIKPHKFQDVIDAYVRGETVQYYSSNGWNSGWMDCSRGRDLSSFDNGDEYRIKPKPDVVKHCHIYLGIVDNIKISSTPHHLDNVKFTFDGQTQELKSVELI